MVPLLCVALSPLQGIIHREVSSVAAALCFSSSFPLISHPAGHHLP
jgi:hypothetical protein